MELRYYQKQAIDDFFNFTGNPENWGKHPVIVLPTAAGKSATQAYIINKLLEYKDTRILMITHQSELIKQNFIEFTDHFNEKNIAVGIYSAGLKCRDTKQRVIFAGIQSVYRKAWTLGWFDLIMVDEVHLVNHKNSGMYRTFLDEMQKINSKIIILGLSATPYRTGAGLITEGEDALFDEICHETTIKELMDPNHFKNKDKKQYLCTLISKNAINKVDLTNVHIRAGEYKSDEMEKAFMEKDLVSLAVKEIKDYTMDRKKVLVFCAGIEHCEDVYRKMMALNMQADYVHSQRKNEENQNSLNSFKIGKIKYILNVGILTTGYNAKDIDCIVLLRSTCSPGLYYQMAGRGLRIFPGKENCLILDFGKNIERMGPIDKIEIKRAKEGKSTIETAPQKECPVCRNLIALPVMICPECGYKYPVKEKHDETASDADIISKYKKPEKMNVESVQYWRHTKAGKPDSLRVDYYFNAYNKISAWICIEHDGYARRKATEWLNTMTEGTSVEDEFIDSVTEALEFCKEFKKPTQIIVDKNEKFPKIVGYVFEEKKEKEIIEEKDLDQKIMEMLF